MKRSIAVVHLAIPLVLILSRHFALIIIIICFFFVIFFLFWLSVSDCISVCTHKSVIMFFNVSVIFSPFQCVCQIHYDFILYIQSHTHAYKRIVVFVIIVVLALMQIVSQRYNHDFTSQGLIVVYSSLSQHIVHVYLCYGCDCTHSSIYVFEMHVSQ